MNSRIDITLSLMLAALLVFHPYSVSLADESIPEEVGQAYKRSGVINELYPDKGVIVVSDINYRITSDIRVHGVRDAVTIGLHPLQVGIRIGFNVTGEEGQRIGQISEVWVLTGEEQVWGE